MSTTASLLQQASLQAAEERDSPFYFCFAAEASRFTHIFLAEFFARLLGPVLYLLHSDGLAFLPVYSTCTSCASSGCPHHLSCSHNC